MAKSFKRLVSEVAQPKGGDEKAFKDQHRIQKFNHPVALDHQFTGEIDKERRMRPADYTAPADAAAYDKATGIDDMGATLGEGVTSGDASEYHHKMHDYHDDMHNHLVKKGTKEARAAAGHHRAAKIAHGEASYDHDFGKRLAHRSSEKASTLTQRANDASRGHADKKQISPLHSFGDKKQYDEEAKQIDEISRSMRPMSRSFGKTVDPKKYDAYKKHMKKHSLDEPSVRMAYDNPDHGESQRMMKNSKYAKALDLYKNSMKEKAEVAESQKKSLEKKLAAASAPSKKGKEAVTLPKAPWDKMKEATEIVLESREMIDEAVRAGNMRLKDGSSVKIKNEDAKLLNQMFKDLNSSNRRQMEKVMMTDKAGFKEILGFAREAL